MKEERLFSIIRLLIEANEFITIEKIANEIGVSKKTIRNDLIKCEAWLEGKPFKLVKKTGQGILLEAKISDKLALRKEIREEHKGQSDHSPQSRVNYIAIRLLASSNSIWVKQLADELYFSRATIQKDLKWVTELLANYKIDLVRHKNHGLRVEGKERRIRNCLVDLLVNSPQMKNIEDLVLGTDDFRDDDKPFEALEMTIEDAKRFIDTLRDGEGAFVAQLPLQAFVTLFMMMAISFRRYLNGHIVSLSPEFIATLTNEPFYNEVERISAKIKENYHIDLPEVEKRFLQVYFISQSHRDQKQHEDVQEAKKLANLLVDDWQKQLGYEFQEKPRMLEALIEHLKPAVIRFKHGLYLNNPLLSEIKKVHRQSYAIVNQSKKVIENYYAITVSEDELGFLTLHLVAALNRMKQPLKTLLVNHIGLGAGNLLEERLSREIPEIQILESVTYFSALDVSLKKYDLILTTIELKIAADVPVLYVNPLIHSTDLIQLHHLINTLYNQKNDPRQRAIS